MASRQLILSATAVLALMVTSATQAAPAQQSATPYVGQGIVVNVDGCHSGFRYHYVPEIGERAEHRHRGNRCVPVVLEGGDGYDDDYIEHCHRNGQRHRHSGFGRTTHSHYGNQCRVEVWDQYEGSGSTRGCIRIGAIRFCP